MKKIKKTAYGIAVADLLQCLTPLGFAAGSHHFVDLWARDSLFAVLGAVTSGRLSESKQTIETFLDHQRSDGLVPYLILRSKHGVGKYFNRHRYYDRPVAHFRSHMSLGLVPDGGLMTIIAARAYEEAAHDRRFLNHHYDALVRAFMWYADRFGDGLVREWFQCEWADALLKSGNTLYTNVLYYKAAVDMSWLAKRMGKPSDADFFAKRAMKIRSLVHIHLWNGSFFADWKDWKRRDYLAVHPNMLAIIFGLADRNQAASILRTAKASAWNGWTMENSFPKYPLWRVPLFHIIIGMGDYHNGLIWLQPGILYALALYTIGKKREARSALTGIEEKIISSGGVHEVYERNGIPVKRLVYRSEQPFAWSSGLFIWVSTILRGES